MSPDVTSPVWETLAAYFSGTLPDAERASLERRLTADPLFAARVTRLRKALAATEPALDAAGRDAAIARLRQEVLNRGSERANMARPQRTPMDSRWRAFKPYPLYRTVGYILTAVVAIAVSWQFGVHHPSAGARSASIYTTTNGERANINLPDGSTVALDVASRLEVPTDYSAGNHTLQLTGEAIFTVLHHGETPFTVVAGGTAVRVLGTSFLVRHYSTDSATTVAVRDGKVAVESVLVTPAHMVTVPSHGSARVSTTDGSPFNFAAGVLTLPRMTLQQAIPELSRWYAIDLRVGDTSLKSVNIQGDFVAGSLADLTRNLELGLDVRVVRDGRTLTLFQKARR